MGHDEGRGSDPARPRCGALSVLEPGRELALGEAPARPGCFDPVSQGGLLLLRGAVLQQLPALEHRRGHRAHLRRRQARRSCEPRVLGDPDGPPDRRGLDRLSRGRRFGRGARPAAPLRHLLVHARRVPPGGGVFRERLPPRRPRGVRASVPRHRRAEGRARDRPAHGRPAWIPEPGEGARGRVRRVHDRPDKQDLRPLSGGARAGRADLARVLLSLRSGARCAHIAADLSERARGARGRRGRAVPDGGALARASLLDSVSHLHAVGDDQPSRRTHLHLAHAAPRDRKAPGTPQAGARA